MTTLMPVFCSGTIGLERLNCSSSGERARVVIRSERLDVVLTLGDLVRDVDEVLRFTHDLIDGLVVTARLLQQSTSGL